jgi:hypothetical protein
MAPATGLAPSLRARVIHGALVMGILTFGALAWALRDRSLPAEALPDRRVLYIGLALLSAVLFGSAMFSVARLSPPFRDATEDEWWQANLGRVVIIWALVEAPTLLGVLAYSLTRDFRTLLAPFIGLFFFASYRPSRLTEH